jgi:hypothetical protein
MILGSMVAAALAGALALPVAGTGSVAGRNADTPPPSANAAVSANPLVSLVGAGFAAIGDLAHAVPILGPLGTNVAEHAFCAVNDVPLIGAVTKASTDKFDKDQQQGNGCASGTSATSPTRKSSPGKPGSGKSSSTGPGSIGPGSSGTAPAGSSAASPPAGSLTIPTSSTSPSSSLPSGSAGSGSGPSGNTASRAGASTASAGSTAAPLSRASDHTSTPDHKSASDHTAAPDHKSASDHSSASDHKSATADAGKSKAAALASKAAPAGKAAMQAVTFPAGRFQLRQGSGPNETCLIAGSGTTAVPGPCDATAAWTYQSGELHPAASSGACLVAATKELEMVSISSCSTAKSWTSHWYLSGTRRLYVRDTDEHGSWRFLGAPGALVVGGVSQRNLPAVPVWNLPTA